MFNILKYFTVVRMKKSWALYFYNIHSRIEKLLKSLPITFSFSSEQTNTLSFALSFVFSKICHQDKVFQLSL